MADKKSTRDTSGEPPPYVETRLKKLAEKKKAAAKKE